jgi:serine/threonine-protein kinase
MLAGAPPFASESPRELLNLQCTAAPPVLPDDVRSQLPRGVERVLVKLLEKSPANRPASADDVIAALDPFVTAVGGAPAPIPTARTPSASSPSLPAAPASTAPKLDTIALIERAAKPREISSTRATLVVFAVCAVTAIAVYVLRAGWPWS